MKGRNKPCYIDGSEPRWWGCRIHWLQKGNTSRAKECSWYDSKIYDSEARVLQLLGVWSTPSLLSLSNPLTLGMEINVRVSSIDQIKLFNQLLYGLSITILGAIILCANNTCQYLKQFICEQPNELRLVKNVYLQSINFKIIYNTYINVIWH